jgi:predicted ATP-grasp superfamily ATP-dependent carboligase
VGYASIEFKKDERDGVYKVIEITPCRFNRQTGLSEAAGFSLPYVWYCHMLNQPVECGVRSGEPSWVSEVNEVRAFWSYRRAGEYTLWEWIKSYNEVAEYEVFAMDDLGPFIRLLPSTVSHWVRRTIARRSPSAIRRPQPVSARSIVAARKRAS